MEEGRGDIRWSGGDREMGEGDAVKIEFWKVGKRGEEKGERWKIRLM